MALHLTPEEREAACSKCAKLRALSRDKDNANEAKLARVALMRTLRKNGLVEADIDAWEKKNKAPEQVPFEFGSALHPQDWRRCIVSTVVQYFGGFAMHHEGMAKVVMLGPTDDMMRAGRAAVSIIRLCEQDVGATFMSAFEFDDPSAPWVNRKAYWSTLPAERGPYAYLGLLLAELIIDEIERIQRVAAATAKGPWTAPPTAGPAKVNTPLPMANTALAERVQTFRGANIVQGWEAALTGEAAQAPPPEAGFPKYHVPSWVVATFTRLAVRAVRDYLTNDAPAPTFTPVAEAKPPVSSWPYASTGTQPGAPVPPKRADGSAMPGNAPEWALQSADSYAQWLQQEADHAQARSQARRRFGFGGGF